MRSVDVNSDLGESFGHYKLGNDVALLDCVTSANIACGFHAGDPVVMAQTVRLALKKGVSIGAHPGYPDLMGFGRRPMALSPVEISAYVTYQIGALDAFARRYGGRLNHVKPHGALYNAAAVDAEIARAIAEAVARVDPRLILVGLAGSELIRAGCATGLKTASEVFADRAYEADGTLVQRSVHGALIEDDGARIAQVMRMVGQGLVEAIDGSLVKIQADTICIHGDGAGAAAFAEKLRNALTTAEVEIKAL